MADYGNFNVSDLRDVPLFSGDPLPGLYHNCVHGPSTNPSPDICPSSPNSSFSVDQVQGQVDSTDTKFLIEIEDDFSVDWDLIDMEEKQEERRARKRFMDKRRQKRLSKGFDVLRSLLPKIGSTKKNLEFELSGALDYMEELKQSVKNLHEELQAGQPISSHLPMGMAMNRPSLFSSLPNFNRGQPKVEVITDDNGNVNIHMSCEYRPGLLHAIMNSLDHLKIDLQQANATCFDGFKLDVLDAKQCNGQFLKAEDIESILMSCAQGA